MSLITVRHSPTGERVFGSNPSSSFSMWLMLEGYGGTAKKDSLSFASSKQTKEKLAKRSNCLATTTTTKTTSKCDDSRFWWLLVRSALSFERSLMSNSSSSISYLNNESYYQDKGMMILACSARMDENRPLCEDRKGFIDHLYPKKLTMSTSRIVFLQGSQVLTQYFLDQLEAENTREDLVMKGKISRHTADREAEVWAEREWEIRKDEFPQKVKVAFLKYHSIILFMRFYEYAFSLMSDAVMLDKFTMDTFEHARRSSAMGKSGAELANDIFYTSLKANFISYFADYTVHQVILCFGYYLYVQSQRRQRKKISSISKNDDDAALYVGSWVLSATKKSALLAMSRALGLLLSSLGGALGSMFFPRWAAWGSLLGSNVGDTIAMTISNDFVGGGL